MADALSALSDAGVSIWLDDLSRERLVTGSLARLAARTITLSALPPIRRSSRALSPAATYTGSSWMTWLPGALQWGKRCGR